MKNFFKKNSGFSLVELFLVILLISLVFSIILPRFRPTFEALKLLNFSKKISTLMRYAQSRAIAEGIEIYFLKKEDSLILTPSPPENSLEKRETLKDRFIDIPESIKINFSGAEEFVFRPDGSIDFVERSSQKSPKIIVSNELATYQIIPQGNIGRIRIEEIYE